MSQAGLIEASDQFIVGLNGTGEDIPELLELLPTKASIFLNEPEIWPAGEVGTLRYMAEWAAAFPDHYVLYLHMKGLSFPPDNPAYQHRVDWRDRMESVVIHRWKECVAHMDAGAESVGQWWNVAFNGSYWAGNFFWVTCKFISTLPYLEVRDQNQGGRYEAELWIGRGPNLPRMVSL